MVIISMLALCCGAWMMYEHMANTQPERELVLRSELEALQATHRLSIAAWQARQDMAEVVRHGFNNEAQ